MDTEIFEFPNGIEVPPVHPGRTLAAELAARYQIDASNTDAMNPLVAKVRNPLARQRGLAREMRGDAKPRRVEA